MFGQIITGIDLYNRLQHFLNQDDELTVQQVAAWIDQAISDFPEIAFPTQRERYTDVSANVEYDLPTDFFKVIGYQIYDFVTNVYTPYTRATKVKITQGDRISFPEDLDTIDLEYSRVQDPYNDLSNELPLRRQLRSTLFYYLVGEYYFKDGEGSIEEHRMAKEYHDRYNVAKAKALAALEQRDTGDTCATVDVMYKTSKHHSTRSFTEYDGNGDVE